MNLQQQILKILEAKGEPMSIDDIVDELRISHPGLLTFDYRSAFLPLMSTGQVDFTKDRGLVYLHESV